MPRNSSGTYTPPSGQPVVSGTTISASVQNALVNDIATEVTDSLSRSGKGGMSAPLRTPDGAITGPSHSFNNETNSGLYRAGAGDFRLAIAGADVLKALASGIGAAAWTTLTAASAIIKGAMADGASAVGVVLDSGVALANATAKVLSIQNGGVEKAYFATDGHLVAPATVRAWGIITLGASPAATVTAGFNVASASWSSVSSSGSITLSNALPSTNCAVLLLQVGGTSDSGVPGSQIGPATVVNFYRSAGNMSSGQIYMFVIVG